MVVFIKHVIYFMFLFMLISCKFLSTGYRNGYNQFVPKNEKYQLKDKKGGLSLPQLDTINIYRLTEEYYDDEKLYPVKNLSPTDYTKKMLQEQNSYMKFYSKGRCLSFSISSRDSLKNSYLNPNSDFYSKDYYYSENKKSFFLESFTYGEGGGMYLIFEYFISEDGESIRQSYGKSVSIYKKEILPATWKKYPVDW